MSELRTWTRAGVSVGYTKTSGEVPVTFTADIIVINTIRAGVIMHLGLTSLSRVINSIPFHSQNVPV